jgi:agmatine deiminase
MAEKGRLPLNDGLSMPARFSPHERSYVAWPVIDGRWSLDRMRREHAAVIDAIARFEPVTVVIDPDVAQTVPEYVTLGERIELLEIPTNDTWIRDNGPIFVTDGRGGVALVAFRFNGWGQKFECDKDEKISERIATALAMRCYRAPFVLEGGGFSVDGEGTLIATEQFLLNPNRNADWSREQIEQGLHDYLGVEKVIWLGKGLVEDVDTDGHSDNVVQFLRPGAVLAQTVRDTSNPNHALLQDNLRVLQQATDARGRRLEVVEMDLLPYTEPIDGVRYPVPYVNYYVVNGAAVVPALGGEEDEEGLARMAEILADREIVTVPSTAMALGGGGVGCITQQQPAGALLG